MANAQHTPGPWMIRDLGMSPIGIFAPNSVEPAADLAKVYVTEPKKRKRTPEYAANVDLIAAAPELLAIVRGAAHVIAMSDPDSPHFVDSGADCLDHLLQYQADIAAVLARIDGEGAAPTSAEAEPATRWATFTGQAWVRDHAIAVDGGTVRYGVTEAEYQDAGGDDSSDYDALQEAALAPQWVKDWSGPFDIAVSDEDPA